eukprot:3704398-Amphidinium_carterae.1
MEGLLRGILEELDAELLQQQSTCYDGVSVGVAIVLGDRLTVATLGSVRGFRIPQAHAQQLRFLEAPFLLNYVDLWVLS